MNKLKVGATALGMILMAAPVLTTPADTIGLLGRSPDDIIELYGVPDMASTSASVLSFFYTDDAKQPACFAFHGDVAIQVPDEGFAPLKITRPSADKVYRGQSVSSAALRLGSAETITMGTNSVVATYADGTEALLALGRVFPRN